METRSLTELQALDTPDPLITDLLYEGNVILLHGMEESFKSIIVLQLAESIALARPFLRTFQVPRAYKVGLIETEIDEAFLGLRLRHMNFPHTPNLIIPSSNAIKDFRRAKNIKRKVQWVKELVDQSQLDFLMVDVANDFFRAPQKANNEEDVAELFDELRSLQLKGVMLVRHDKKFQLSTAGYSEPSSNEKIRGSGEWKEDPEVTLYIHRKDKRTNQATLEVGKNRYGKKPPILDLWFDAGTFRLTPLNPVLVLLENGPLTREQLLQQGEERFSLGHSKVDKFIKEFSEAHPPLVYERQQGHQKVFAIDYEIARKAGLPLTRPLSMVESA